MSDVVVSLADHRAGRKAGRGKKQSLAVLIPFKPKSSHGDSGLREAEGQLSFIDISLEVEERVEAADGPDCWASAAAYEAQRTVRQQRIIRYLGEAEGARRYIIDHPAHGVTGAAIKLRMALAQSGFSDTAERLVRDALKAIAPTKPAATSERDGAA